MTRKVKPRTARGKLRGGRRSVFFVGRRNTSLVLFMSMLSWFSVWVSKFNPKKIKLLAGSVCQMVLERVECPWRSGK